MGGRQSQIQGQQFENILQLHCNQQNVLFIKLPVGAKPIGKNRWIKQQSPFDFILVHNGSTVFLDCKTLDQDSFSYSRITHHQVISLRATREHGCLSGYLVWHRPSNQVVFYEVQKLLELRQGKSLKPKDGIPLGRFEDIALGSLFYYVVDIEEKDGSFELTGDT